MFFKILNFVERVKFFVKIDGIIVMIVFRGYKLGLEYLFIVYKVFLDLIYWYWKEEKRKNIVVVWDFFGI